MVHLPSRLFLIASNTFITLKYISSPNIPHANVYLYITLNKLHFNPAMYIWTFVKGKFQCQLLWHKSKTIQWRVGIYYYFTAIHITSNEFISFKKCSIISVSLSQERVTIDLYNYENLIFVGLIWGEITNPKSTPETVLHR